MSQRLLTFLIGLVVTLAMMVGLFMTIWFWIDDRPIIHVDWLPTRPVDLLSPQWLLLASVVPAFYLLRIISLTDLSLAQQVVQSTLRSLVLVLFAIALSRPSWITEQSKVSTVVLVDVSDSVSDKQLEAAKRYVTSLEEATRDGDLQLITFAEKPIVPKPTGDEKLAQTIKRHAGAGAGSDIQSAMQLAYGLYPDGYLPRMVVVSDGNQTVGDIAVEGYRAKELGVKVSWRTFDQDKTSELRVVGLTAPDDLKVGQPFDVTAEVWSTEKQNVTLGLMQDEFSNPLEGSKKVELREGKNIVKFKSDAKRAGATTYRLTVQKFEKDTEKANNYAVTTAPVKGRPNILYVEGGMLREPNSATYFRNALEHENMDVQVRGPSGLPSTIKELEKFDLVVVSDVPAHLVGSAQMAALDSYAHQGGGMIMAGGQDSFGSGGYQGTRMEQILPVRFDSEKIKDQPDVAVVVVMDKSGSMQGQRIEMAKESARATAEALSPQDYIAVVAFDSEATVYVRPQRATNRMRISAEISRLSAGGGTNIFPGLKEAFEILQNLNAKVKHVILLSDGESPTDGISELVQDMRASRITVSCVGVPGADRNLLTSIAEQGDGRLYMVEDIGALPKIFAKETKEAQKSQLVEDKVYVRVAKRVEAIEGINFETAPPLHGYVTTKPKPTGEVILISDLGEPILARWRYGAGTTLAWTSDVKNRWAVEWIRWGGYPKFWAQVVRTSMRRKVFDSYDLTAKVNDGRALVTVDAIDTGDKFVNEMATRLEVIDPATNKTTEVIPMAQTAAGRYTADFRIQKYGSYLLKAVHKRGEKCSTDAVDWDTPKCKTVAVSEGSVALSYPLEYLRTTPNLEPLKHAAQVSGGLDQADPAKVFNPGDESVPYTQDLWPYVLLGVVGLFLLDLYAKRVRLFGYRTIKFS